MNQSNAKTVTVVGMVVLGLAIAAAGIYIGEIDDAPGAALIGFLLMIALVTGAVKTARKQP